MGNILKAQSKRYSRSSCLHSNRDGSRKPQNLKYVYPKNIFKTKPETLSLIKCTFQTLIENLQEIYARKPSSMQGELKHMSRLWGGDFLHLLNECARQSFRAALYISKPGAWNKYEVWFSWVGKKNHAQRKIWLRIGPIRASPNHQPPTTWDTNLAYDGYVSGT